MTLKKINDRLWRIGDSRFYIIRLDYETRGDDWRRFGYEVGVEDTDTAGMPAIAIISDQCYNTLRAAKDYFEEEVLKRRPK